MSARPRFRILAVGRLKERHFQQAQAEYIKRLSRYGGVDVDEVDDEPAPERIGEKQRLQVMDAEGARLLQRVAREDWLVALDIRGRAMDSEAFAARMRQWLDEGKRPVFAIGGSLGLCEAVLARSDDTLSLSPMTFCHPLARVLLLEQLYRAQRINAGQPYHK